MNRYDEINTCSSNQLITRTSYKCLTDSCKLVYLSQCCTSTRLILGLKTGTLLGKESVTNIYREISRLDFEVKLQRMVGYTVKSSIPV